MLQVGKKTHPLLARNHAFPHHHVHRAIVILHWAGDETLQERTKEKIEALPSMMTTDGMLLWIVQIKMNPNPGMTVIKHALTAAV